MSCGNHKFDQMNLLKHAKSHLTHKAVALCGIVALLCSAGSLAMACAIPLSMCDWEYCILFLKYTSFCQDNKVSTKIITKYSSNYIGIRNSALNCKFWAHFDDLLPGAWGVTSLTQKDTNLI